MQQDDEENFPPPPDGYVELWVMKEKLIRRWIPPLPQWVLKPLGRHGRIKTILAHVLGYDYGDADYIYQMRRRRARKIFYIPTGEDGP